MIDQNIRSLKWNMELVDKILRYKNWVMKLDEEMFRQ
jgi:hypothetical protein